MGIAKEIKILKEKNSMAMELRVRVGSSNVLSNIKDVGYGVPLQIPILFQSILSEANKKKGLIFIEQPEIHLYPRLQASFIETLLSIGDNNSYFIETHSEHIIRKLQILIKNRKLNLKPEDISILYFKKNGDISSVVQHLLNESGRLNPPIPSDFFDTSYNLIKDLMF